MNDFLRTALRWACAGALTFVCVWSSGAAWAQEAAVLQATAAASGALHGEMVLSRASHEWMSQQVEEPCILPNPKVSGRLIMFYSAVSSSNRVVAAIGKAWAGAKEPFCWHQDEANPIFEPAGQGWDSGTIRLDTVLYVAEEDAYYIYYSGTAGSVQDRIGLAICPAGADGYSGVTSSAITRYGSAPVLAPEAAAPYCEEMASQAAVLREWDAAAQRWNWFMYYSYRGKDGVLPGIRLATSQDGKSWTRHFNADDPRGMGQIFPSTPNAYYEWHQVFKTGRTYVLCIEVGVEHGARWRPGLAVSTEPARGWTQLDLDLMLQTKWEGLYDDRTLYHVATPALYRIEGKWYLYAQACGRPSDNNYINGAWEMWGVSCEHRIPTRPGCADLYIPGLPDSADALRQARKEAAWKRRRIMYNDDGCHVQPYTSPEELIALRLRQLAGTQVDAISYCTGGGGLFWGHVPKVGELIGEFVSDTEEQYVKDICSSLRALEAQGTDPLAVAVQFGHANGMEVFWSSRMNNIEDSFAPWSRSRWKREHPEYLFGKVEDFEKYEATDPRKWWAALDFAVPEVRDYLLRIFDDVFTRYDVDGIEMDWFRAPRYFRETNEGRPVEPQHVAMMTDFVRKARALSERVAAARNRPFLIACRVPLSEERCLAIGLDVRTWLEEGLVDLLVLGGDLGPMAMAPQLQRMVELAHTHGVPAMANLCGSGLQPAHGYFAKEAWWAAGMNAWHAGVDGIYTFNLFPSEPDERFVRLGSPETLKGLDKVYAVDSIQPGDFWGFDRAGLVVPDRLPIALVPDGSVSARLPVGEDFAANAPEGAVPRLSLRIRVKEAAEGDQIRIALNGTDLGPATAAVDPDKASAGSWFEVSPPIPGVKAGENRVDVHFTRGSRAAAGQAIMDRLELTLAYVPNADERTSTPPETR